MILHVGKNDAVNFKRTDEVKVSRYVLHKVSKSRITTVEKGNQQVAVQTKLCKLWQ